jgi:hypothetical protein
MAASHHRPRGAGAAGVGVGVRVGVGVGVGVTQVAPACCTQAPLLHWKLAVPVVGPALSVAALICVWVAAVTGPVQEFPPTIQVKLVAEQPAGLPVGVGVGVFVGPPGVGVGVGAEARHV